MNTVLLTRISILSTLLALLFLTGCGTPLSSRSPTLAHSPQHYLKLSTEASSQALALGYRLQAADLYIEKSELEEAQTILRDIRENPSLDPLAYKTVLNVRLSLLNQETAKARALLKPLLMTLLETAPDRAFIPGFKIALLLPSKGPHAPAAKAIREGFLAAYYQNLKSQPSDTSIKFYDTHAGSNILQGTQAAYQKALAEGAHFIVGPLTKEEVQALAHIKLERPVLALNTLAEGLSLPAHLYQFGLMPEDEVVAAADKALQKGYQKTLVLAPNTEWGKRLAHSFKRYWHSQGGTVLDTRFYQSGQDIDANVRALLKVQDQHRRQDADMLFLVASADRAKQIKPLLNYYFADDLPVFSTSSVLGNTPLSTPDRDLDGLYFCDMPCMLSTSTPLQALQDGLAPEWQSSLSASPRFFALGMDAYAVSLALQQDPHRLMLQGLTGQLEVNPFKRIQRKMACAKFENGIPVPE